MANFVASTTANTMGTTSTNLTQPTSVANDILVIVSTNAGSFTASTPSGYTQLWAVSAGQVSGGLFYKVATGSESGTSIAVGYNGYSNWNTGPIAVGLSYRNVNFNNAIRGSSYSTPSSLPATTPNISTTSSGDIAINIGMVSNTGSSTPGFFNNPATSRAAPSANYAGLNVSDTAVTGSSSPGVTFNDGSPGSYILAQLVLSDISSATGSKFYTIV